MGESNDAGRAWRTVVTKLRLPGQYDERLLSPANQTVVLAVEETGSGVVVGPASSACGHAVYSSPMYHLPYAKVTLRSALPTDDFVGRLSRMVAPPKLWFRWPWDPCEQEFEGEVNGRDFEIS